jgi:hypothetical protein
MTSTVIENILGDFIEITQLKDGTTLIEVEDEWHRAAVTLNPEQLKELLNALTT